MSNPQLTIAAPFTAILYLLGSWLGGYAISIKLNTSFNHYIALTLSVFAIITLAYFSYINPQIWLRLIILNASLGLIGFISIPAVLKFLPSSKSFNRWILIFYLLNVSYSFCRAIINFIFLDSIDRDHIILTSSTWWLLGMSVNIILNILFAIVISGGAVKDVIQHLNNERLEDPLTQLLNRRGFFEKSEKLAFGNHCYFLVCLDLDHFKSINDTWGHYVGDQVLQKVSRVMLQHKKPNDLMARFGGEEFICLISAKDATEALFRTKQLKIRLEQSTFTNHKIKMTASYGLTQIHSFDEIEQGLQRADDLLYQAKENGRNQISFDLMT
ncbi:GGDEF domain-containing protein [Acinetobacter gyllenbergii]|uniref:GGDEF domain-containing protein n=1 Tax=Acinetobacter gyllenbergii TaxID=134534 RepID=UPI0009D755C1|nr:GGDEF domain-containing protein [Acinetobacter gyllenbergii]